MKQSYDHIVVGAGVMGSATTYSLAKSGQRVALLEQFDLSHDRGSSHGNARIFRLAYDRHVYVQLAAKAREAWLSVQDEAGIELLRPSGALDAGPKRNLESIAQELRAAGFPPSPSPGRHENQFALPDGFEVIFQPDGGVSWASRALQAFQRLARDRGADLRAKCPVTAIEPERTGVRVHTATGDLEAESVIVAAGSWADRLLRPLGITVPLRITREHVAYYSNRSQMDFLPFIWHPDDGQPETYGLPNLADDTVKIGRHIAGMEVDPDTDPAVVAREVDLISKFVRDCLPGLDPNPVRAETCLYASTPDDDFVIERVGRIVIGAGFGGHGFKFAPVVGQFLADLARGFTVSVDSAHSFRRFEAMNA